MKTRGIQNLFVGKKNALLINTVIYRDFIDTCEMRCKFEDPPSALDDKIVR